MKTQITCLNPYKIKWGVVVIEEGFLTKPRIHAISKITGHGVNSQNFFFHGQGQPFEERCQNVINNLAVSGVHGKMYIITDKQYGMISNSWNGQEPERAEPFTHQVTIRNGNHVCVVPLSLYQVETAQSF